MPTLRTRGRVSPSGCGAAPRVHERPRRAPAEDGANLGLAPGAAAVAGAPAREAPTRWEKAKATKEAKAAKRVSAQGDAADQAAAGRHHAAAARRAGADDAAEASAASRRALPAQGARGRQLVRRPSRGDRRCRHGRVGRAAGTGVWDALQAAKVDAHNHPQLASVVDRMEFGRVYGLQA